MLQPKSIATSVSGNVTSLYMIKTRYSLEPTGPLHLSQARDVLFNCIYAEAEAGKMVLRVGHTSSLLPEKNTATTQMVDLTWLGLHWHEGPHCEQGSQPYYQAERASYYQQACQSLLDQGLAYYCFCSSRTLLENRIQQRAAGLPLCYPQTCLALPEEQINKKLSNGDAATVRFKVGRNQDLLFEDLIRGSVYFETKLVNDFIIKRSDQSFTSVLMDAVDDLQMKITHVFLTEQKIHQSKQHSLLMHALGGQQLIYAHLPLLQGFDHVGIHERNGDVAIKTLRNEGYCKQAVLNLLMRLGYSLKEKSLLKFNQFVSDFQISNFTRHPSVIHQESLKYWQLQAFHFLESDTLWLWLHDDVKALVPHPKKNDFLSLIRLHVQRSSDILAFAHACFSQHISHDAEHKALLKKGGTELYEHLYMQLNESHDHFEVLLDKCSHSLKRAPHEILLPLRVALTGMKNGPELSGLFGLMDRDLILRRIEYAIYHS